MSPLSVTLTIAIYFIILFTVSYFAGRKTDNAGFFTGNRRSSWYLVALAMIGASMSGVTYVSVPGMVATSSFGYLQMTLGFTAGQLVIAYVLVPLFYRMNLTSIYEYLAERFGLCTYHTGAWFFFISKMLGAAVRLFLVCLTLQLLVIWTDSLKTLCLVVSVVLCIVYIARDMGLTAGGMVNLIRESDMSRMFFFDDVNDKQYFFKQFFAGMFTMIAMTGLDQDMMQRNLSCRNSRESQKNMITSTVSQFFVILLFLMLGVLLYTFAGSRGIEGASGDALFPLVATGGYLPLVVGVLFIIGLISSAYSAAGSALTALTTSFTVDILGTRGKSDKQVATLRKRVHVGMAVVMGLTIYVFNLLNDTSTIDAVYTLASYTYGPILGLFAFGIFTRRQVRDRYIPVVAILSPALCYVLQRHSEAWFGGYQFSYELLILNALFTFIGLCLLMKGSKAKRGLDLDASEVKRSTRPRSRPQHGRGQEVDMTEVLTSILPGSRGKNKTGYSR